MPCSEVILVQPVGRDQLLAAEFVWLAGYLIGAEVGDDSSIWIVGRKLFDGTGGAVDDGAVVTEVVLRVVVEGDG